jgi:DEAD/DEAH box helicase domain-containing protein
MELLMRYLEEPDAERLFNVHAKAYAFSLLDAVNINNSAAFAEWNQNFSEIMDALRNDDVSFEFGKTIFGKWTPRSTNSHLTVYGGVAVEDMRQNKMKATVFVYALLNDKEDNRTEKYDAEWNGFWQFANVMQFLEQFSAVSAVGLRQMVYSSIPSQIPPPSAGETAGTPGDWSNTMTQLIDDAVKSFVSKCVSLGIPEPTVVGYELTDSASAIVGEAELVWEHLRIALLTPEQSDGKDAFLAQGWNVLTLDDEISPLFKEVDS